MAHFGVSRGGWSICRVQGKVVVVMGLRGIEMKGRIGVEVEEMGCGVRSW